MTSLTTVRFSAMALVSVGLIGITGLYSASLRVGTIAALLSSIYGHALLFKQIFVVSLLAIAGINLVLISPRLKRARLEGGSNVSLVNRFTKLVFTEVVLAGLLLVAVSLLTYLPPARITLPNLELNGTTRVDDLSIAVAISPGQVGQNTFTLRLMANGKPVTAVKEALLRFTPLQGNFPPSESQLISLGDGSYTAKGTYLSLPGKWQVQAVVRRVNQFDAYANFNFNVQKPGSTNSASTTPHVAGALILFNGLLVGLLMVSLPVRPACAVRNRDPPDRVHARIWLLLHDPAGEGDLQRSRTRFHPTASPSPKGKPSLPNTASFAMVYPGKGMARWE